MSMSVNGREMNSLYGLFNSGWGKNRIGGGGRIGGNREELNEMGFRVW